MKDKEAEMVENVTEEHHEVNRVLGELDQGDGHNDTFIAMIAELTKMIDNHSRRRWRRFPKPKICSTGKR
jgi:hypothetical protein